MKAFEQFIIGNLALKNRFVMAPMCMYSAKNDGLVTDFHLTHYETRAIGGVGLIIVEATAVNPMGVISEGDLGIYNDQQVVGLTKLVKRIHAHNTKIGIQLGHAGRKYGGSIKAAYAPSAIAFDKDHLIPTALSEVAINAIIDDFVAAAKRAEKAGFDMIEIHAAHGYLIHEFLSPLTNHRDDQYGGSLENRVRFLKTILAKIKQAISPKIALTMRVSASDYVEGGLDCQQMIAIVNLVKPYLDLVHVSSGGLVPVEITSYPGYQVNFAEQIKHNCEIPVIAVGKLEHPALITEILNNERADLIALGRGLLREPYFVLNLAKKYQINFPYPTQYKRSFY